MIKKRNKLSISILLLLAGFFTNAQTIKITGKVTDSINNPLEYANVFAVPTDKNVNISYAITNEKGKYILKLKKDKAYKVTTSFLGFVKQEVSFKFSKDSIYNFKLKEDSNQLDEVTLNYTIPVKVKEDTITYNADSFKTGEERKLKDVLKKLPGIEVDRKGNVTANGKKIKKLLVEDKPFFGGNTKLGVNNIPADAIDKVQVLENYNDVAMLKGLQDSDDSVLNIKLKKDKKKFIFGDVEVGAGIENRYLLHPKLFYYSPKTSVNFIGDVNNQGVKSFTFQDYLEFEGGIGKMLGDFKAYFSLYNSDFAKYLTNQDYTSEKNNFGAFSIRHSVSTATDLSAYVIGSKSTTTTKVSNANTYLIDNQVSFTEDRIHIQNLDNLFAIGKITVDYDPNKKTDYAFSSFFKITNSDAFGNISTNTNTSSNFIKSKNNLDAIHFKQSISLNKNASKKHTITLDASYTYNKDKPENNWQTNQAILQGLIPLQPTSEYHIFQDKYLQNNTINALAKDYWVLHRFHHIYTSVGFFTNTANFSNTDGQLLNNQTPFIFNDFQNDFQYNFLDAFVGLEYKFKIKKATFKPAIFYHNYHWNTKQFQEKNTFKKQLFLPQFTMKIKFKSSENLNLKYRLNTSFANVQMLANKYILSSFNSVYKGNINLENSLYHNINLNYYKYNLYKGYHFSVGGNFSKKVQSVKSITQINGINQFNTNIMFDRPETRLSFHGSFSKKINKMRYKLGVQTSKNDYYQIVNTNILQNESISYTISPSIKTYFKTYPNLEIAYNKQVATYKSGTNSTYIQDIFRVNVDYDFLEDYIFNADFSYTNYEDNQNNQNEFLTANAKLFYQKEDSPWGFELQATNILKNAYKQNNTISEFIISDTKTYILPRIFMFKVSYKL